MKNKHILLSTVSCMIIFSFEVGAQCVMSQDCAALGYTQATSCVGGVKCPFGNKWYCPTKCPPPVCAIGFIYYSDNTCSAEVIVGKTALGVVVYVTDRGLHGQVMTAYSLGEMTWGGYRTDISELPNYETPESASKDFNSCSNTDKIVAYGGSSTYPAAHAARNYAPTTETKGKWCLPAAGIMTSIKNNLAAVQAGITQLGGTGFQSCCTWSSSEYNLYNSWYYYINGSYGLNGDNSSTKNDYRAVRPVMEF